MLSFMKTFAVLTLLFGVPAQLSANGTIIENFEVQPETRWRFFADTVMGGVSSGQVAFKTQDDKSYAHMTGRVSTANNGGFIQIRMDLTTSPPAGAKGIRLVVRGNEQNYFVHLRTNSTLLPWQYYQAEFGVSQNWTEIKLPFSAFEASGRMLSKTPRAPNLKSIGIVAFGRDHSAEIDVQNVSYY